MRTQQQRSPAREPSFYTGQTVYYNGRRVQVVEVEVGTGRICIGYPDGSTQWVSVKNISVSPS